MDSSYCHWNLDSGLQSPGFRIPWGKIPGSRNPDLPASYEVKIEELRLTRTSEFIRVVTAVIFVITLPTLRNASSICTIKLGAWSSWKITIPVKHALSNQPWEWLTDCEDINRPVMKKKTYICIYIERMTSCNRRRSRTKTTRDFKHSAKTA